MCGGGESGGAGGGKGGGDGGGGEGGGEGVGGESDGGDESWLVKSGGCLGEAVCSRFALC